MDDLTPGTFAPHVGDVFRVGVDGSDSVGIELVAVEEHGPSASPRAEPFSLLFLGPAEPFLPQRIYRFEHDAVGPLDIFIVPIGPEPGGTRMRYEAVFN